jgi:hypothetical protein
MNRARSGHGHQGEQQKAFSVQHSLFAPHRAVMPLSLLHKYIRRKKIMRD